MKINPTTHDYQMLSLLVDKGTEVLKECGIKMVDGCAYDFHTQKAFGIAKRKEKKITINYFFFKACIKNNHFHEVENTMIHEMLHIIVMQVNPRIGHTGLWKQLALKVTNMTDYKIVRLGSTEKLALKNMEHPPKYTVVCTECGKEYYYHRDCNTIHQVRTNSPLVRCGRCKGKLKLK